MRSSRHPLHSIVRTAQTGLLSLGVCLTVAATSPAPELPEDDRGVVPSLDSPPSRLVLLSPSVVEMAYALGVEERIVGVSRYSRWPEAARALQQVGGGLDPDAETILRLNPDLIISSGSQVPPVLQRLERLGVAVAMVDHHSLDKVFADFLRLGLWLGVPDAAQAQVRHLQEERMKLRARASAASGPQPSVLVLYGFHGLLSAGADTFASDLVALAGGRNLADTLGRRWPVLSDEQILRWNPDIIVFSLDGGETPEQIQRGLQEFAADPRWSLLSATAGNRLYAVEDSLLAIPGPRSLRAAEVLFSIIHEQRATP